MAVANGRARSWDQQLPSNFLPLRGERRLQLVLPLDLFFKFRTTTSSLPFRSTQIGILKRTCKGHFCVWTVLLWPNFSCHAPRTASASRLPLQRPELLAVWSGHRVVLKSVMEPAKVWFMTFSKRGTLVLIDRLESCQTPHLLLSFSLLLWCRLYSFSDIIKCHKPWLLVHKTFPAK